MKDEIINYEEMLRNSREEFLLLQQHKKNLTQQLNLLTTTINETKHWINHLKKKLEDLDKKQ